MILNLGLNGIRDYVSDQILDALGGTGTTLASTSDLGLEGTQASSEADVTVTKGDRNFTTAYVMTADIGGTTDYSEHVNRFDSGTVMNRVTFQGVNKDSSSEVHVITQFNILNS